LDFAGYASPLARRGALRAHARGGPRLRARPARDRHDRPRGGIHGESGGGGHPRDPERRVPVRPTAAGSDASLLRVPERPPGATGRRTALLMRRYLRLYRIFWENCFVREAEFRANFWANVATNFGWLFFFV